jgi:hypothetical protein
MDLRLKECLDRVEIHIRKLFSVEWAFLMLDANRKPLLAELTRKASGKSHSEREAEAYASQDWKDFALGLAEKEAEFNRERRRHELLMASFHAEYSTFKVEAQTILKQGVR